MEGNLTKGPILKTLTKLAVPIMASAFLGTLYNITDMAWIGLLGSRAVAGVYASHNYERSHMDGVRNTFELLKAYITK